MIPPSPPNPSFQPTSLPPETFPSTCGRVLGGKAAAELVRWAARGQLARLVLLGLFFCGPVNAGGPGAESDDLAILAECRQELPADAIKYAVATCAGRD